jgi:hypothetical protein
MMMMMSFFEGEGEIYSDELFEEEAEAIAHFMMNEAELYEGMSKSEQQEMEDCPYTTGKHHKRKSNYIARMYDIVQKEPKIRKMADLVKNSKYKPPRVAQKKIPRLIRCIRGKPKFSKNNYRYCDDMLF